VPKTKWWLWLPLGAFGSFLLFGLILSNSPEGRERINDRYGIDFCWSEHKRKSLDPSSQRFVASTCEMMEDKFTKKYGYRP
jgi:hypothetical protein